MILLVWAAMEHRCIGGWRAVLVAMVLYAAGLLAIEAFFGTLYLFSIYVLGVGP